MSDSFGYCSSRGAGQRTRPVRRVALLLSLALLGVGGCSSGGADSLLDDDGPDGMCKVGFIHCSGKCIDPQSDPAHCGATGSCQDSTAGTLCARDRTCVNGVCVNPSACGSGQIKCDGRCTDPLTDAQHCGASADCAGANAGMVCQPVTSRCGGTVPAQCQAGRCGSDCPSDKKSFVFTGRIERLTLPSCVTEITAKLSGAQGGNGESGGAGGLAASVEGKVCVPAGSTLSILVGEQAPTAKYPAGGGGGSYVALGTMALFVAGGGGGAYGGGNGGGATAVSTSGPGVGGQLHNNGGGGGGFTGDGMGTAGSGGASFANGGKGGSEFPAGNTNCSRGGFGGGGGSSQSGTFNSGGGGGYDGGNCGNGSASTGGSSYIAPNAVGAKFTPTSHAGHGSVEISY